MKQMNTNRKTDKIWYWTLKAHTQTVPDLATCREACENQLLVDLKREFILCVFAKNQ